MLKFVKVLLLIFLGGLLGFALSVSLGDRVAARLSRVPIFKDYKLVSMQAPIVIHTREEVVSRGDADITQALEKSRQKVSALLTLQAGRLVWVANALNLTSDGLFMAPTHAVNDSDEKYIQLPDGNLRKVNNVVHDAASGLSILQASGSAGRITVANFGDSTNLRPGERLLWLATSPGADNPVVAVDFVAGREIIASDAEAGYFNATLITQSPANLIPGQAVVNMNGEIVGLWKNGKTVPASVLNQVSNKYLSAKNFTRPAFGFAFHTFTPSEAEHFKYPNGSVLVLRIGDKSPADNAGLIAGDIITHLDEKSLSENPSFEERLLNSEFNKPLTLTVLRAGKETKLNLTPNALK